MDSTDLNGRTALIAGASGGLGGAIAAELGRRGVRLVLSGRDEARLAAVAATAHRVHADLRTPGACADLIAQTTAAVGPIDILVNATGLVAFGTIDELSVDAMEDLFLTNTFLPIMLTKAALAAQPDGHASLAPNATIVQLSGVIAEQNLPGMAAYGASKAALRAFDEAAARELRRRKIRVIDARPPHTETGLAGRAIEGEAPTMPTGLSPESVAQIIVDAIAGSTKDLPAAAFTDAATKAAGAGA